MSNINLNKKKNNNQKSIRKSPKLIRKKNLTKKFTN